MQESIQKALEVLRAGGVILYPTDTVWGIGCDATNPEAVAKVYEIKRPEMAIQLVEVNDKPMTIIYPDAIKGLAPDASGALPKPDRRALAFNTVAEDGSVGIRIPMMEFCRQLVFKLGRPLVSTSANISGEQTPKRYAEISEEIRSAVDHVVDPSLERGSTGQSSSIIKVGLDYSIEIIRK